MTPADELIKKITRWAKDQEDIRALILMGSYARKGSVDQLSDIDLQFFSTNIQTYLIDRNWFEEFGTVWLSHQDQSANACQVIYEDGLMVEFYFAHPSTIQAMQEQLPSHYETGYKILIDKDRLTRGLPKASGKQLAPQPPSQQDFEYAVEAFWWDAFQYVKYLWRDELWRCKHYDWQLKQHLLEMMGWHALLCRRQVGFTTYQGSHLKEWTDPEVYIGLMSAFGRFYPADSWRALDDTVKTYVNLSEQVAKVLNTAILHQMKEKFIAWKKALIEGS